MRGLIGLLLTVNLGVFAAGLLIGYWPMKTNLPDDFNADKIILSPTAAPPTTSARVDAAPTPEPAPSSPPAPNPATDPVPEPAPQPTPPPQARACLRWGGLDADQLERIEATLKRAGLATEDYVFQSDRRLGWWVYLPPYRDEAAMRDAIDELRQKGVTDLAPVRGQLLRHAISLGAFPDLAKARLHAASLTRKGVSGHRVGARPEVNEIRLKSVNASKLPAPSAWPAALRPTLCPTDDG